MENSITMTKQRNTNAILYKCFIVILFVVPRSFAIDLGNSIPLLTIQRLAIVFMFIVFFKAMLGGLSLRINAENIALILYVTTSIITTMITWSSTSLNGLFSILFENIGIFFIICQISKRIGVSEVVRVIQKSILFICVLGIVEFILQYNLFSLLITNNREGFNLIPYFRNGILRIAGPFVHSLGYSSFLCLFFPLMTYDLNKQDFNLSLKNIYFILLVINVILTQSRSSWLCLFIEFVLILGHQKFKQKIKFIILGVMVIGVVLVVAYAMPDSVVNRIVVMIVVLFTRSYSGVAENFGGNINPFSYRNALFEILYKPEAQTLFGQGLGWVRNNFLSSERINSYGISYSLSFKSIDNFYISHILQVGYVGIFAIIFLFGVFAVKAYRSFRETDNVLFKALFVSMIGYYIQLFFVDDLGYLYFIFVFFALYVVLRRGQNGNRS